MLTHIKLGGHDQSEKEDVKKIGGLFVLGTERMESRRVDNQARGRSGRQGDEGSSIFFVSLEDDLMRLFGSDTMNSMLEKLGLKNGESIDHPWINKAIERAQQKVEARNFDIRKTLIKFDNVLNDQRHVIFEQRKNVIEGLEKESYSDIFFEEVLENLKRKKILHEKSPNSKEFPNALKQTLGKSIENDEIQNLFVESLRNLKAEMTLSLTQFDDEGVKEYIKYWEINRKTLPFEIDGVVIKINKIDYQNQLGFTSKFPRWAISYKYKAENLATRLESISFNVGRTGAITPVANLEPVLISGSTVKRASLHSYDQMLKLKLRVNDYVFVEKGGEIIPKITGIDEERRGSLGDEIIFPEICPECNSKLEKLESEANYFCINYI